MSEHEIQKISESVAEQEKHTIGEIVPVIVRSSSYTGQITFIIILILMVILLLGDLYFKFHLVYFSLLLASVLIVSPGLSRILWIQKLLVPDHDELTQVHQRAELEFCRNSVHKTHAHTGILIFVSIMERKAVILADEGIAKKLPPEKWKHILNDLLKDLKEKNWGPGFIRTIEQCGSLLKEHYPSQGRNGNELSNQLIIKD